MSLRPRFDSEFSLYISNLIRTKARKLARGCPHAGCDSIDFEQQLALQLWKQREKYQPNRGAAFDTFASRVIESASAQNSRDLRRIKRGGEATIVALDGPLAVEQVRPATIGDMVGADADCRIAGNDEPKRAGDGAHILKLDVTAALSNLSPEDRSVCIAVMEESSIAAAAERLGTSRQAVYRVLERLRSQGAFDGLSGD